MIDGKNFPIQFHCIFHLVWVCTDYWVPTLGYVPEYDRSRIFDIRPKPKTLIQKIRPSAEDLSGSRSYGTIGFCGKQNGYCGFDRKCLHKITEADTYFSKMSTKN